MRGDNLNIYKRATNEPQFKIGLNGNYYVFCKIKEPLMEIVEQIGKSVISIYFNEKYNVWAIRVKSKKHKEGLNNIFRNR